MSFLIIFLKSIIILLLNLVTGYLFVWLIKLFLVLPRNVKYFGRKKIPLTPGLLIRKRNKYFNQISKYYNDYMKDSKNEDDKNSIITEWEDKAYHFAWGKTEFMESFPLMTKNFKENLRHWMALMWYEFIKQFLRTFVPFVLEKYKVEKHLITLDKVTSAETIQQYYNKYIHKFLLIFFLIISAIVGIINMIFFMIVY